MDRAAFYAVMRSSILGPTLSQGEVDGCDAILDTFEGQPLAYTAYALATAYHETAGTMQPIREYGGPSYFFRMYDINGARPAKAKELGNLRAGDGIKYAGRGYVQLTGRVNYAKAEEELGAPFVANPDLAMHPKRAADIMLRGMLEGWFTGRTLKHFLPANDPASFDEFEQARRIINGMDRAADIAQHAVKFQDALVAGSRCA